MDVSTINSHVQAYELANNNDVNHLSEFATATKTSTLAMQLFTGIGALAVSTAALTLLPTSIAILLTLGTLGGAMLLCCCYRNNEDSPTYIPVPHRTTTYVPTPPINTGRVRPVFVPTSTRRSPIFPGSRHPVGHGGRSATRPFGVPGSSGRSRPISIPTTRTSPTFPGLGRHSVGRRPGRSVFHTTTSSPRPSIGTTPLSRGGISGGMRHRVGHR